MYNLSNFVGFRFSTQDHWSLRALRRCFSFSILYLISSQTKLSNWSWFQSFSAGSNLPSRPPEKKHMFSSQAAHESVGGLSQAPHYIPVRYVSHSFVDAHSMSILDTKGFCSR